jgi:arylsulfatase A-like enzyme
MTELRQEVLVRFLRCAPMADRSSLSKLTLCFLLALGAACGGGKGAPQQAGPAVAAQRPHVMILVLDACRADKFGAYGFERPTSPAFDALAAEPDSVLFRWQISQAPHTRASTASLFTGVYPFQHGVSTADDLTAELESRGTFRGRRITERYETLAERFTAGGYRTVGYLANPIIPARDGFAQGFGGYFGPTRNETPESDSALVDHGVAFLAEAASPAFAYVHTTGCHSPLLAGKRDEEYFTRYGTPFDVRALVKAGLDPGTRRFKFAIRSKRLKLDAAAIDYLNTVYESVVRKADRENVTRVVEGLRKAGIYDRTLLVVTADHGDELYDHGNIEHGRTLWNEVLHVPLVVKFPRGRKPSRLLAAVERVTQSIDLNPGILKAVGLEPAPGIAGHDLFDPDAKREVAYSQAPGLWSLVDFPQKVVVFEKQKRAGIYDFVADPHEQSNLAASRSAELRRLVRLGEGLRQALPKLGATEPESDLPLDAETIEQLRSLGYIQ